MATLDPELLQQQADADAADQDRRERELQAEEDWYALCEKQQWDEIRQIGLAESFIREKQLFTEFNSWAQRVAKDEDEEIASVLEVEAKLNSYHPQRAEIACPI
jgi:hypothetical protein